MVSKHGFDELNNMYRKELVSSRVYTSLTKEDVIQGKDSLDKEIEQLSISISNHYDGYYKWLGTNTI